MTIEESYGPHSPHRSMNAQGEIGQEETVEAGKEQPAKNTCAEKEKGRGKSNKRSVTGYCKGNWSKQIERHATSTFTFDFFFFFFFFYY